MFPSPILNPTCHGHSLAQHPKEKKLKERNEKKRSSSNCMFLFKEVWRIYFLTEKENAYRTKQFPTCVFSFSVLPISYLCSHLSNSRKIKRAQRQKPPQAEAEWTREMCSVVQLADSRAVHWLLAHQHEHFHMNNTWIDIESSQIITYWESLRN